MTKLFPNDPNANVKSDLVHNLVENVEELLREPNSAEDHFGVVAQLAHAFVLAAVLRDRAYFLTEDDRTEISATAGVLLDEKWTITATKRVGS